MSQAQALEEIQAAQQELEQACKWMDQRRATIIFADSEDHVRHFFEKMDKAMKRLEEARKL